MFLCIRSNVTEWEAPLENAIEITNLTKQFGDFTAVNNVSFNVKKGEVFGFLGPNGSGKTTVIRMLLGLITPTSGVGKVLGYDVANNNEILRSKTGYMSQKFSLYEELTVKENLDFYAGAYNIPKHLIQEKQDVILKMADLVGKEDFIVSTLSGGWKQRLALGCSIIHEPEILLLDEPTGGVDPIARRQFWDIIYNLSRQGVTILVTTHYMDEAEHCSNIGFLYYGNVLCLDTPRNLKNKVIQGDILQIKTDQTLKAIETLKRHEKVREASVYGAGIHALVEEGLSHDDLTAYLTAAGLQVRSLKKVQPSLEDVFVFLVETEKRKQQNSNS